MRKILASIATFLMMLLSVHAAGPAETINHWVEYKVTPTVSNSPVMTFGNIGFITNWFGQNTNALAYVISRTGAWDQAAMDATFSTNWIKSNSNGLGYVLSRTSAWDLAASEPNFTNWVLTVYSNSVGSRIIITDTQNWTMAYIQMTNGMGYWWQAYSNSIVAGTLATNYTDYAVSNLSNNLSIALALVATAATNYTDGATNALWQATTNAAAGLSNNIVTAIGNAATASSNYTDNATNNLWNATTNAAAGLSNNIVTAIGNSATASSNYTDNATNALWQATTNETAGLSNNIYQAMSTITGNVANLPTNAWNTAASNATYSTNWISTNTVYRDATNASDIMATSKLTSATNVMWVAVTNLVDGATNVMWIAVTNLTTGLSNNTFAAIGNLANTYSNLFVTNSMFEGTNRFQHLYVMNGVNPGNTFYDFKTNDLVVENDGWYELTGFTTVNGSQYRILTTILSGDSPRSFQLYNDNYTLIMSINNVGVIPVATNDFTASKDNTLLRFVGVGANSGTSTVRVVISEYFSNPTTNWTDVNQELNALNAKISTNTHWISDNSNTINTVVNNSNNWNKATNDASFSTNWISTNTVYRDATNDSISTAKSYTDQATNGAVSTAKAYTDQATNGAVSTAKAYTDQATNGVYGLSKTYTDNATNGAVSTAKAYTDQATNGVYSLSKTYTDNATNGAVSTAKAYTDSATNNADFVREAELSTATNNIRITSTNQAISAAKTYTDSATNGAVSTAKAYRDQATNGVYGLSKTYTDQATNGAVSTAKAYTDSATNNADFVREAELSTATNNIRIISTNQAISAAKTYTDSATNGAVSTAKAYTDSATNGAVSTAKSYTDSATNGVVTTLTWDRTLANNNAAGRAVNMNYNPMTNLYSLGIGSDALRNQFDDILTMVAPHGTPRLHMFANAADATPTHDAHLFLWASEAGITFTGAGIGNNFRAFGSNFARYNTTNAAQYIRFDTEAATGNRMLFGLMEASGVGANGQTGHQFIIYSNGVAVAGYFTIGGTNVMVKIDGVSSAVVTATNNYSGATHTWSAQQTVGAGGWTWDSTGIYMGGGGQSITTPRLTMFGNINLSGNNISNSGPAVIGTDVPRYSQVIAVTNDADLVREAELSTATNNIRITSTNQAINAAKSYTDSATNSADFVREAELSTATNNIRITSTNQAINAAKSYTDSRVASATNSLHTDYVTWSFIATNANYEVMWMMPRDEAMVLSKVWVKTDASTCVVEFVTQNTNSAWRSFTATNATVTGTVSSAFTTSFVDANVAVGKMFGIKVKAMGTCTNVTAGAKYAW